MDDEDGLSTLQTRLRMKKAITFAEQREHLLKQRVFSLLASLPREKRQFAAGYYSMILCVKSFKGIMEFAISNREMQMREDEERERASALQEEETLRAISVLERTRKERNFRRFYRNVQQILRQKREKQSRERIAVEQSNKKAESIEKYHKTDFPIRSKETLVAQMSNLLDKTSPNFLQTSRRSIISQGLSTQQDPFKRKLAPIKSLPPKPQIILDTIQQPKPKINAELPIKQSQIKPQLTINEENKLQLSQLSYQSIPEKVTQRKNEQPEPHIIKIKDKILGLLSEIKMAQITSLSEIVQQYSKTFKSQSNIAEKHRIKESLKLLQRISLIK